MQRFRVLWKTEIRIRIDELRHRLRVVEAETSPPELSEALRQAHLTAAKQALDSSEQVIEAGDPGWSLRDLWTGTGWERLREWWTGSAVTAAWEYVHEAQAELVELESEGGLKAALPPLMAWMQDVVPADGRRKRYEQQLTEFIEGKKAVDRTVVRQAYRDVIIANNEWHANIRGLRNRILLAVAVLGIFLCGLALWHAINPNFVSLCGTKPVEGATQVRCVSGGSSPNSRDIFEIELIGAIAGLLGLAFSLGSVKTPPSRYDPRVSQLLLKPVAGAATAVLGVIFVQSEIFLAPPRDISESILFAYAATFGFSQQLLTQLVDKRAGDLLKEPAAEEKES